MQKSFVNEAIIDLLADNKISEVDDGDQMHNINSLSVAAQPSEKKRLILNLRSINSSLKKYKFKFIDHKKALETLEVFSRNSILRVGIITSKFLHRLHEILATVPSDISRFTFYRLGYQQHCTFLLNYYAP